jgi:hypothetical protein
MNAAAKREGEDKVCGRAERPGLLMNTSGGMVFLVDKPE